MFTFLHRMQCPGGVQQTFLQVLYIDYRRAPGTHCMQKLGQKNVNFEVSVKRQLEQR